VEVDSVLFKRFFTTALKIGLPRNSG